MDDFSKLATSQGFWTAVGMAGAGMFAGWKKFIRKDKNGPGRKSDKERISNLEDQVASLQDLYTKLERLYNTLEDQYHELQGNYDQVVQENAGYKAKFGHLESNG